MAEIDIAVELEMVPQVIRAATVSLLQRCATLQRKRGRFEEEAAAKRQQRATDLSPDQVEVLALATSGVSLFYSGAAGCGKSFLLRRIAAVLRAVHGPSRVALTSSTGVAAVDIGGRTLHSWAGVGIAQESADALAARVAKNHPVAQRWRDAKVLIIDEVSMISGGMITKLDAVAKHVRRDPRPFGGLQVIACGDHYQLPPVDAQVSGMSFQSDAWRATFRESRLLTVPHRQSDPAFLKLLDELREGRLSADSDSLLRTRIATRKELDTCGSPRLLPYVAQTVKLNTERLAELPGQQRV